MKLRIRGDSIRVRLDRKDIEKLVKTGRIEDAVHFGPGRAFSYAVEARATPRERPEASYEDGAIIVRIDPSDVAGWLASDRVGFENRQAVEGGTIRVLLEKDFACVDRPPGEEDDTHAFPNPALKC